MRSTVLCLVVTLSFVGNVCAQEAERIKTETRTSDSVTGTQETVIQTTNTQGTTPDSRSDDKKADLGAIFQSDGVSVTVQSVYTNGPSHQQDIRSGDQIKSIDGKAINTTNDIGQFLKSKDPGDMITVTRQRETSTDALSIKLMSRKRLLEVSKIESEPNANISRQYVGSGQIPAEAIAQLQQRVTELEAEMESLRSELEKLKK